MTRSDNPLRHSGRSIITYAADLIPRELFGNAFTRWLQSSGHCVISVFLVGNPLQITRRIVNLYTIFMIYLGQFFWIRNPRQGDKPVSKPSYFLYPMAQIPLRAGFATHQYAFFINTLTRLTKSIIDLDPRPFKTSNSAKTRCFKSIGQPRYFTPFFHEGHFTT